MKTMSITAAAAAFLLSSHAVVVAATRQHNNNKNGSNTAKDKTLLQHQPSRQHAPPRPIDAPDVKYEHHPFDQYRHLYDDTYNHGRRRRRNFYNKSRLQQHNDDGLMRSRKQQQQEPTPQISTVLSDNSSIIITTTTLDQATDTLYQPLRIQFDVRQLIEELDLARSAGNEDVMTKLQLLIFEVLPMTAQVWGDTLRVIPVSGGIYPLAARGSSAEAWLPNGESGKNNDNDGSGIGGSVLYEDPVRAFYCPDETTSGISGGADLLIYATVNRHCGSGDIPYVPTKNRRRRRTQEAAGGGGTLASALSCQRDQYDRPITGSIDFCLSGMDGTSSVDVDDAIAQKEAQGYGPTPNDNGENVIVGSNGASLTWDGWFGKSMDLESSLESNWDVVQYSAGVAIHGE